MLDLAAPLHKVRLELRIEVEDGEFRRNGRLGDAESLGSLGLRTVEVDERTKRLCLLQRVHVVTVDVGDEGRLKQSLVRGDKGVVDADANLRSTGKTCCGKTPMAVDDDIPCTLVEVGRTVRTLLQIGLDRSHRHSVDEADLRNALRQPLKIAQLFAGVVGVLADEVQRELGRIGDAGRRHTRSGTDRGPPGADGAGLGEGGTGPEVLGLTHLLISRARARSATDCSQRGA